ncbi:MAG: hypothetical protein KA758_03585 [Acidimicrobiales bacterium]|nr:hypothetical protein [Acidimicrobiales bacterium]
MIPPKMCPTCGADDTVETLPRERAGNFYCHACSIVFAGSDEEWARYATQRRERQQELALAASGMPGAQDV